MTTAALRTDVVACTRAIDPPADLLSHLGSDGFAWLHDDAGMVTAGVLARVPARNAAAALAAIEVDDDVGMPGTGAVAAGALPFGGAGNGSLVIPARVTGVAPDGTAWRTELAPLAAPITGPSEPATRFVVRAVQNRGHWARAVDAVLEEIAAGRLTKAVLAREAVVEADQPLDARAVVGGGGGAPRGGFV
jgi:menaquinone-specific isochorismate synthase